MVHDEFGEDISDQTRPDAPAVQVENIPTRLRDLPRWFIWRFERRDGRLAKVPYRADVPGVRGKPNDAATASTFEMALAACKNSEFQADGLGFLFVEGDALGGVDLDDSLDGGGALKPWAREILDLFPGCYWEVSPSGKGLKIFVEGTIERGRRISGIGPDGAGAVEFYGTSRYFTVTGNSSEAWGDRPIGDGQAGLTELERRYAQNSGTKNTETRIQTSAHERTPAPPLTEDDLALLDKARKGPGGDRFAALYDRGDLSPYAGDESRADMALMGRLERLTDGDAAVMERLFDFSALGWRDKWRDRPDYRERTLRRAIEGAKGGDDRDVVELLERTDVGNALEFSRDHARDLRYCSESRSWLAYDGTRFAPDSLEDVTRRAKETIRSIAERAVALRGERGHRAQAHARSSASQASVRAMIGLAQSEAGIGTSLSQFDAEPMLFNCRNGTIDLRSGHLLPHDRSHLLTKLSPVDYDPDATCPVWDEFLTTITGGDVDLASYLRRWCGYCLTGLTREHAFLCLHGSGRNGKSTFLNTLMHIAGEYADVVEPSYLVTKPHDDHPCWLAALPGKRIVTAAEFDARRPNEGLFKRMTGGDPLSARVMRGDPFSFVPAFKLVFATNHPLRIVGRDLGIWSRVRLVRLTVTIPPHKQDRALLDKLRTEAPGILASAVRGCLEWQRIGLSEPKVVRDAISELRADTDTIAPFLDECVEASPSDRVKSADLFTAYRDWCRDQGHEPASPADIGHAVSERGFESRKSGGANWRLGLRLKE